VFIKRGTRGQLGFRGFGREKVGRTAETRNLRKEKKKERTRTREGGGARGRKKGQP